MPPKPMSGEGSRQLKEMFKPRQVPERTAADDADKTAAAAAAHAPAAAPTDIPAAVASTDFASGGAAASGELATPAPEVPSPATPQTADGSDSAGTTVSQRPGRRQPPPPSPQQQRMLGIKGRLSPSQAETRTATETWRSTFASRVSARHTSAPPPPPAAQGGFQTAINAVRSVPQRIQRMTGDAGSSPRAVLHGRQAREPARSPASRRLRQRRGDRLGVHSAVPFQTMH